MVLSPPSRIWGSCKDSAGEGVVAVGELLLTGLGSMGGEGAGKATLVEVLVEVLGCGALESGGGSSGKDWAQAGYNSIRLVPIAIGMKQKVIGCRQRYDNLAPISVPIRI